MPDILQMNYYQIQEYIKAAEFERNERLVMLMNVMAVAFGGTAKSRRELTDTLLGLKAEFDPDAFDSIFSHLATPVGSPDGEVDENKAAILEWAATEFDPDDPAFKVK